MATRLSCAEGPFLPGRNASGPRITVIGNAFGFTPEWFGATISRYDHNILTEWHSLTCLLRLRVDYLVRSGIS
jgi:hypothetical protein